MGNQIPDFDHLLKEWRASRQNRRGQEEYLCHKRNDSKAHFGHGVAGLTKPTIGTEVCGKDQNSKNLPESKGPYQKVCYSVSFLLNFYDMHYNTITEVT